VILFAGIPVAGYADARAWYERLFGRPPDLIPNENEAAWQLSSAPTPPPRWTPSPEYGSRRARAGGGHNRGVFDPARGYPMVAPYLRYADPVAAVRWLGDVLGAREAVRMTLPDGRVGHVEMVVGRSVISLGLLVGEQPTRPLPTRQTLRAMTLVFVEDVDAAVVRALATCGTLVDPATDQPWGLRQAVIADPGGHLWELSQHLGDVPFSAWGAEEISPLPG
jgi:PhnB protein